MKLNEAIAELKELKLCIIGRSQRIWIDREACEAIDTVVSHYEKSEKIEFFKSAKQPSEITHPYDLSKKMEATE